MKIKSAKFIKSCADRSAADTDEFAPQIAVAGRSNCGKSSLLNMLMGAKLCKTSSTPGRTQLINVFQVVSETPFYFIDLPGYGYSAAQKSRADEWSERTDAYFRRGTNIAQVLCLMDIRRDPSDLDKTLINYLRDLGLPFTVVLTKADKLSRAQVGIARINIAAALGLARDNLFVTSASKNLGK
ncbi:MAG: ribosome biogenesis GTP-binding protein YihA/YsxC, partial [Clostridiales bacterium]|nr:ribosome biogenesis GTP-binding protein YihA/YsxC [Clostridiales bacterium]